MGKEGKKELNGIETIAVVVSSALTPSYREHNLSLLTVRICEGFQNGARPVDQAYKVTSIDLPPSGFT